MGKLNSAAFLQTYYFKRLAWHKDSLPICPMVNPVANKALGMWFDTEKGLWVTWCYCRVSLVTFYLFKKLLFVFLPVYFFLTNPKCMQSHTLTVTLS